MKAAVIVFLFLACFLCVLARDGVVEIEQGRCNNKVLAEIMKKSMSASIQDSRDKISMNAEKELGGNFGVICSQDDLASAIQPVEVFCQAYLGFVSCLAFKRG